MEQLSLPMPEMGAPDRLCPRCRLWWPLERFPLKGNTRSVRMHTHRERRKVCKWCWQEISDKRKRLQRFYIKARTTRRDHAKRLHISIEDLDTRYGWQLEAMARDAEHAYLGDCGHCNVAYAVMPNGLADMTLDVIDRAADPLFGVNTQWLCMTGNRQKGEMTQAEWTRECRDARRWQQAEEQRN